MAGNSTPGIGRRTGQSIYRQGVNGQSPLYRPHYKLQLKAAPFTGTSAVTLAAVTSVSSGTLTFSGTSSVTLSAVTSASSGTLTFSGTSAVTIAPVTSATSGTLTFSGSSAVTLAPVTSATTGTLTFSGTSALTIAAVTSVSSGTFTGGTSFTGTSAVTLAPVTASSAGTLSFIGQVISTFAAILSAIVGLFSFIGTMASTVSEVVSAALGVFTSAQPPVSLVGLQKNIAVIQVGDTLSNVITNHATSYKRFYVVGFNPSGTIQIQGSLDKVTFFDLTTNDRSAVTISKFLTITSPGGSTEEFTTCLDPFWIKNIRYIRFKSNAAIVASPCYITCF